ncbi:uncharacterized protein VTP21DRAFT_264 [Calcarisporiella thermophila]|uniref:uncharacterized protein n=1 Tax=Calcarisporiella thermophila TaxID=911321 RepID=UPI0037426732
MQYYDGGQKLSLSQSLQDDSCVLSGSTTPNNELIDYLSYTWGDEEDIAVSWRVMTKQKNSIINGIRLENASWRCWFKQKYNLPTASPEQLNWLKDSDVTWLYGPLYFNRSSSPYSSATSPSSNTSSGNNTHTCTTPTNETSPSSDRLKPVLKKSLRPPLLSRKTDLDIHRRTMHISSKHVLAAHRQPRLRFNDAVEQCIAIESSLEDDLDDYEKDEGEEGEIDKSDNDNITSEHAKSKPVPIGRRRSKRHFQPLIIKVAPTRLKPETTPRIHTIDDDIIDYDWAAWDGLDEEYTEEEDPWDKWPISNPSDELSPSSPDSTSFSWVASGAGAIQSVAANATRSLSAPSLAKAKNVATNVRDLVQWCTAVVFNSSVV